MDTRRHWRRDSKRLTDDFMRLGFCVTVSRELWEILDRARDIPEIGLCEVVRELLAAML
jgi:hypothetical protein